MSELHEREKDATRVSEQRVLAAIGNGIVHRKAIWKALPLTFSNDYLGVVLANLVERGAIIRVKLGYYQRAGISDAAVVRPAALHKPPCISTGSASGFIRPVDPSRLMGRRA